MRRKSGNVSETQKKNRIFDTCFHTYECLSLKRDKIALFFVVSQIWIRTSWLTFFFLMNEFIFFYYVQKKNTSLVGWVLKRFYSM